MIARALITDQAIISTTDHPSVRIDNDQGMLPALTALVTIIFLAHALALGQ